MTIWFCLWPVTPHKMSHIWCFCMFCFFLYLAQLKVLKLENRWWKVHLVPVLFEKRGNDRTRPFKSDECKTLDWERPLRASQAGYVHSSQSREKPVWQCQDLRFLWYFLCFILKPVFSPVSCWLCLLFFLLLIAWFVSLGPSLPVYLNPTPLPLFARLSLLPIQARSHYLSDCFFCQTFIGLYLFPVCWLPDSAHWFSPLLFLD